MSLMPDAPNAVAALESQKAALLRKITQLDDFRAGSVTTTTGRCGNPVAIAIAHRIPVTDLIFA